MTAKRYHKLFQSEMTKLMAGKPGAGKCLRAARVARPIDGFTYAAAWADVRRVFMYGGNIPPSK